MAAMTYYDRVNEAAAAIRARVPEAPAIGIQIGGIGALAPNRRHDLARLGLRAMFAGTLANFMTATIAGFLL